MWPSFSLYRFLPRTRRAAHRDERRAKRRPRAAFRPRFEILEDRFLPTNITWTGGAGTNWSNPANWAGGAVPGAQDTAVFDNTSGTHNVAVVDVGFTGPIAGLNINPTWGGEITIANPLTVTGTFSQAGGTVDGAATLTLAGTATWSAGTMSGSGTTLVTAAGTLALSSGSDKVLSGRTLTNLGTITWTGGNLLGNGGGVLNNRSGATIDLQTNARFYNTNGPAATFFNAGTFQKSAGPGTGSIEVPLNNAGKVLTQAGTVSLNSTGTDSGNFDVSAGATLVFAGGSRTLPAGATVTGAGTVAFNGANVTFDTSSFTNTGTTTITTGTINFNGPAALATLNVTGGTVNFNDTTTTITTLNQSGGTTNFNNAASTLTNAKLNGGTTSFNNTATITALSLNAGGLLTGPGNVTLTGASSWMAGQMAGTGTTIVAATGTLAVSGGNDRYFDNRTLTNAGTITWTDSGRILARFGSVLNNQVGATFDIQTDSAFVWSDGSTGPVLYNFGTLQKSAGIGTTDLNVFLVNQTGGKVDVQSGTIAVDRTNSSPGSFTVEAGATLSFPSNAVSLSAGSTVSGAGTVLFNGGVVDINGTYNVTGTTSIQGGTANFNGKATIGTLAQSGGTANFNNATTTLAVMNLTGGTTNFNNAATVTAANLANGGVLAGTGSVTFAGASTWSGGQMTGTGTTVVAATGTLTLSSGNDKTFDSRTLSNAGTITWTDSGNIVGRFGSTLLNQAGATFDIQNDARFYNPTGATPVISNFGTLQKSAGVGTTDFNVYLNNKSGGTVDVQTGTVAVEFSQGSAGAFTVEAPGTLYFSNGTVNLTTGSSISGAGTVVFNGGPVTIGGSYNVTGTSLFLGGTTSFNGPTTIGTLSQGGGNLSFNNATTAVSTLNLTGGNTFFNSAAGIATLNLADGGNLVGTGLVTLTGTSNWTGGVMDGSGTTVVAGTGTLALSGGSDKTLSSRTLNNAGTITWSGSGNLIADSSVVNNQAGATFDIQTDAVYYSHSGSGYGPTSVLNNVGTLQKSAGVNTTSIQQVFNNTGTVLVLSGNVNVYAGTSTGNFNVSAGASLSFAGGTHVLNTGAAFSGNGLVIFSGAVVNFEGVISSTALLSFAGGTVNFDNTTTTANANLLPGGSFGGSGNLRVTNSLTWTGGTMGGTGVTTIAATATLALSGGSDKALTSRTINNAGAITWAGGGNLVGSNGSILNNQAGATFDAQNDAHVTGGLTFNNLGTFKKSAGITATGLEINFNSTGAVLVQAAALNLNAGTSTGTFTVAVGATLNFAGGTHNLENGAGLTGAGTVAFTGATVNFNGTVTSAALLSFAGGTVNFNGAATTAIANLLPGGSFQGSGNLTITGALNWTGGVMSGSGVTTIPATATVAISGGDTKTLQNRTLNNAGVITWTGSGNLTGSNGSILNNQAGATFDAQNDAHVTGGLTFNNLGTFKKSAGIAVTGLEVNFNNAGAVLVQAATLNLNAGTSTGTFTVAGGATLNFAGGTHNLENGASLTGAGTVSFTGATVNFDGTVTSAALLNFAGGTVSFNSAATTTRANLVPGGNITGPGDLTITDTLNWTGGQIGGSGTLTIPTAAKVVISGGSDKNLYSRTLNNAGTITVAGTGNLLGDYSSVLNNQAGATFDIQNDARFYNPNAGKLTFNNFGTVKKSAGIAVSSLEEIFNNTGTVLVQAATLNLNPGTSTGTFTVSAGATLNFAGSTYNLEDGTKLTGAGTVAVTGATVNFDGTITSTAFLSVAGGTVSFNGAATTATANLTNGTVTGNGSLTVTGTLNWTGGVMGGNGTTVLTATATAAISGGDAKVLQNRTLNNAGVITWTGGGNLIGNNGSILNNQAGATFDAQSDARFYASSGSLTFNNLGTLKKSAGIAVTSLEENFNNQGSVQVKAATLSLSGSGISAGAFTVAAGAALNFAGGAQDLVTGASLTGAGAVLFSGGAGITFDGATYNVTGPTTVGGSAVVNFTGPTTMATLNQSGGTTNLNAAAAVATLNQTGGTINGNAAGITFANLNLSGGGAFINNTVTAAKLTLVAGGTLGGSGTLKLTGDSTWTGGTMTNSGTTVVAAMATLTLGSANDKVLNARTLTNAGTITWTGPGNIQANNGTTINNQAGAVFDIQTDATLYDNSGPGPVFNNAGTVQKSAGGGTATIQSCTFNNNGTVDVQTTTLSLGNAGTSSGAFTVEAGATLAFVSGNSTTLSSKASLIGAGTVSFNQAAVTLDGATYNVTGPTNVSGGAVAFNGPTTVAALNVSGGTATFTTAATVTTLNQVGGTTNFNAANTTSTNLNLSGGNTYINNTATAAKLTLGGSGNLSGTGLVTLTSDSTWSAGSLTGSGTTVIAGTATLTLSGAADKVLNGRTLTNAGIMTWTGTGNFQANSGCVINNLAGATFYIQTDAALYNNSGAGPTFNNAGTVQKSAGSGVASIQSCTFNNSGTVDVQTTTLSLGNAGTNSGTFTVEAGATLTFFGGNSPTLTNHAGISGAGSVSFNGGGTVTLAGATYNVTGTTSVSGGAVVFNGPTTVADLELSGGTVNFTAATAAVTTLDQTGGNLTFGNVSTTVTSLNLRGGNTYINSSASAVNMTLVPGATLAGTGTLTLTGASSWTGGAMTDPGITTIAAGGTLTVGGGDIKYFLYRTLNNAGTITWTGTGDIYGYYGAALNNLSGGTIDIQNDATFVDYSGPTRSASPTLTNAGTLKKSMGIAVTDWQGYFNNSGSVKVQMGTLNVNTGTSAGSFDTAAPATLRFGGGTHSLTVSAGLTGAGTVLFATNVNVDAAVNITGTANVGGGTVTFTNAATSIAALNLSGGTTYFNNTATVANLSLAGATLSGIGVVTITGTANWTGGTMNGSGVTLLAAGSTLALSGGNEKDLVTRNLTNAGTITWTGLGNFALDNGSTINNQAGATFDIQNDARLIAGSGQPGVTNYGTVQKSAGFANSNIEAPLTNNGTVKVLTAMMSLTNSDTSPGAFTVAANATLRYPSGTHSLTSTSSLSGAGNLMLTGATLSDDGTVNLTGTLSLTGGTATFNGSLTVGPIAQNAGTANFNGATTFGTLTLTGGMANFNGTTTGTAMALSGGTLAGAGTMTLSGASSWMAGTLAGTGTTVLAGTATLSINSGNDKTLDTRSLSNAGIITWTGNGNLMLTNGSVLTNQKTGLLDAQNDARLGWNGTGTEPTFNNFGTFQKSAGLGTTSMEFTVNNNAGTIKALSGNLNLTRDGTSTGTYQSGAGATLNFTGSSTHTLTGGSLGGAGAIRGMGATLLVTGAITGQDFTLLNGTLKLANSGTLTLAGNYTQGANATLLFDSIKGTTAGVDFGQLLVTGTASLQGTLTVTVAAGYVPPTAAVYKVMTFGSRVNDFGTKNIPATLAPVYNPMDLTLRSTHTDPGGQSFGGYLAVPNPGTGLQVVPAVVDRTPWIVPGSGRTHHKPAETDVTTAAVAAPDDLDALFAAAEADLLGDPTAADFLS